LVLFHKIKKPFSRNLTAALMAVIPFCIFCITTTALTFEEIENYQLCRNFAHASFLPHATCVEMIKDLENIKEIWQGLQNHLFYMGKTYLKKSSQA
jgi:transposase